MKIMNNKQKGKMGILLVMMVIGAVLETASISLIIPVMTLVINPDSVQNNALMSAVYNGLHMQSTRQFTIVVMMSMIFAARP